MLGLNGSHSSIFYQDGSDTSIDLGAMVLDNVKMARRKQLEFEGQEFERPGITFGGSYLKGNPKGKRPLDSKLPIHVVLRAEKSLMRLPKTFGVVHEALALAAKRHGVKIYRKANVGNHLHLLIRVSNRRHWAGFIRSVSGHIALAVRKSLGLKSAAGFWKYRPFTRLVSGWKKAFLHICDYIELNRLEAEGHLRRNQIKSLRHLRALFADG